MVPYKLSVKMQSFHCYWTKYNFKYRLLWKKWKAIITIDFLSEKQQFQYITVIVAITVICSFSNLKPLNYDHFIVNEQNICI